uniref:Uncharacterized protein n=1 Tax=Arundo donax TaxID=35708 RepID=A0A0A9C6X9_ARUDO
MKRSTVSDELISVRLKEPHSKWLTLELKVGYVC